MKIEIPEGFFPPPGVPFETEEQRDLACALGRMKRLGIEFRINGEWRNIWHPVSGFEPNRYRLAATEPRTFGPVVLDAVWRNGRWSSFPKSTHDVLIESEFKNANVKITVEAVEVVE